MSDPIDPLDRLREAAQARHRARGVEREATEALRLACIQAHAAGVSLYRIERITGLASATVRRWCNDDNGEDPT